MRGRRRWDGRARLSAGWALFRGAAGDNRAHRHQALQLVLADQPQTVLLSGARHLRGTALLIGAGCLHQLQSGGGALTLLYMDSESLSGRALAGFGGRAQALPAWQGRALRELVQRAPDTLDREVAVLLSAEAPPAASSDARVAESLRWLRARIAQPLSLKAVAAAAGLSPGRYAHLFRAHCGLPLRPYLRWLRLQAALLRIAGGSNLTEAAHAAGFADSAHLSRTCRASFGITPQQMLAVLRTA